MKFFDFKVVKMLEIRNVQNFGTNTPICNP